MKVLRLFIDDNLEQNIQWSLVENNEVVDSGSSTFTELQDFENLPLEIYLSPHLTSIFKLNIAGISSKNLTDELILGLIEDDLTEDILELKPIIMNVGNDDIFVAVINKNYFNSLLDKLYNLNKQILFIQSFAYTTIYPDENIWAVYLNNERSFVRTSKFQYYLLDDNKPIPLVLEDMLKGINLPKSIIIYNADNRDLSDFITKSPVPITIENQQFQYGALVWNFYNPKSNSFNFKLDTRAKKSLRELLPSAKYFILVVIVFWLIRVINLEMHNLNIQSELNKVLHVKGKETSRIKLNNLRSQIVKDEHDRGLYAANDAITLLHKFLQIVAGINQTSITGVDFQDHQMFVFLNDSFQSEEFNNYKHIFTVNRIDAKISDYKTYAKAQKDNEKKHKSISSSHNANMIISDNTQWVINFRTNNARNK